MTDNDSGADFAAFLFRHAKGRSHAQLSEQLADIVRAVLDTGKPGKLTYTVTISPMKKVEGMVKVEDKIRADKPEFDRDATLFFAEDSGELSLDNPNQEAMFPVGDKA